jgi:hypothetical protein
MRLALAARSSGPLDVQRIDFLVAGVASKDRRAIRRDIDLSLPIIIHYAVKVFEAGDGLYLMIGEPVPQGLWFCASCRVIEVLAIRG